MRFYRWICELVLNFALDPAQPANAPLTTLQFAVGWRWKLLIPASTSHSFTSIFLHLHFFFLLPFLFLSRCSTSGIATEVNISCARRFRRRWENGKGKAAGFEVKRGAGERVASCVKLWGPFRSGQPGLPAAWFSGRKCSFSFNKTVAFPLDLRRVLPRTPLAPEFAGQGNERERRRGNCTSCTPWTRYLSRALDILVIEYLLSFPFY